MEIMPECSMGIKQDEEPYHITQSFTFDVICVNLIYMLAFRYMTVA